MGYRRGFRRLLANVYAEEVPDEFWNRFYNISSGPSFRLTNYEFESKLLKAIGCPAPERKYSNRTGSAIRISTDNGIPIQIYWKDICISAVTKLCDDYFKWMASQVPWYFPPSKRSSSYLHKTGYGSHR